jgi:hypothetical protein
MLNRFFGYKVHSFIHIGGMCILAIGMPLNKVLMSVGVIGCVGNLLLEGNMKKYGENIRNNKTFLWLLAFFTLHLLGLIWSSDWQYAAHDLKIKLPLLAVPLALTARPIINRKHIHLILWCLLASLLLTTTINFAFFQHWVGNKIYLDIRQISLFGSHIRIGILVSLGAGLGLYFFSITCGVINRLLWLSLVSWFILYTFYSQILSGAISLGVVLLVFVLTNSKKYKKLVYFSLVGMMLTLVFVIGFIFYPRQIKNQDLSLLPTVTEEGNLYIHDLENKTVENSNLVFVSVCDVELQREWEKRSRLPYAGKDKSGQYIRPTVIRYLASKNLEKNALGMRQLSVKDIQNIENGIASIGELNTGIIARFHGIKYQLDNAENPNGHSLLQRIEYWKTGFRIAKENWLFGVGTGDVQLAFDRQYAKDASILAPENRLRAHNMYLTVWISFGVFGLVLFVGMLMNFAAKAKKNRELIAQMFVFVALVSFWYEDMIETQLGVCIVAFFLGLFIHPIGKKRVGEEV